MGTVSLRKSQKLSLSLSLLGSPICEAQAELRYVLTSYAGVVLEVGSETPGANNVLQQLTWIGNLR